MEAFLRHAFATGYERHGDLNFDEHCHAAHLRAICGKYIRGEVPPRSVDRFLESLHIADIYLCLGCARGSARAWQIFADEFHAYIGRLAAACTDSDEEATDLTDDVIVDLYLPDRAGRSRIASFDGRSSLATWLRVLVSHRAVNERKRSRHRAHGVDRLPETADHAALLRVDAELREHRYGEAVHGALRRACATLSDRERLVIQLRFDQVLKVQDIAARIKVHPSNVTRQIDRVCERLRAAVVRTLGERYQLSRSQIDECLVEVVENPRYSILSLLEQTESRGSGRRADVPIAPTAAAAAN